MVGIDLAQDGQVEDCCEQAEGLIRCWEFLVWVYNCQVLKKDCSIEVVR